MTNTAQALYQFFSSFGIPAYTSNNIPDNVSMPYITYELKVPSPLSVTNLHAWVWYRGNGFDDVLAKCNEIESALEHGYSATTPSGAIRLFKDDDIPFAQEQPDPDRSIRVMFLTMILHANTT